ncbi:hypothetical protein ACHAPI_010244 [Fusarium lateritium]
MPITIRPADHPPRAWYSPSKPAATAEDLFRGSCRSEHQRCKKVIQSSLISSDLASYSITARPRHIYPTSNAFVSAVQDAYCQHHHLIIRPEDVWFAIVTQFSFYVNGNAEKLRDHFVSHDGQKDLMVSEVGTVKTVHFGPLATYLTHEMSKNMIDPELREWIIPAFATTTDTDKVTAAVLMMGSMQKYFTYTFMLTCGIPSVTLLGSKMDWKDIRVRLDKLREFGEESVTFANLLVPIIDHFVRSFEAPQAPEVLDFWSKVADRRSGGSGPSYLSGWITAFCYWDVDGKPLYAVPEPAQQPTLVSDDDCDLSTPHQAKGCVISGTQYGVVDTKNIPFGFVGVPLQVKDNGVIIEMRMVAGSVGIAASSSGDKLDRSGNHTYWRQNPFANKGEQEKLIKFKPDIDEDAIGLDTLECVTGWWLYELS